MIHGFFIGPCSAKARLLSPLFQSQGISDLGGIVAEPGQFHLQLGFPGGGAGGEYLQDEVKPVQHSNSKLASDVVDLAWAERIIEDQPVGVVAYGLLNLSPSYLEEMVPTSALANLCQYPVSCRLGQAEELPHPGGVRSAAGALPYQQNRRLILASHSMTLSFPLSFPLSIPCRISLCPAREMWWASCTAVLSAKV